MRVKRPEPMIDELLFEIVARREQRLKKIRREMRRLEWESWRFRCFNRLKSLLHLKP
jgi:hypothetical protein